jgi:excisionase family DNA binding protein
MNFEATTENEGGLIAVKQAAERLAVSPRTVWRMIAEGQLKVVRIRRCTRLSKAEIENCASRVK